MVKSAWRVWAVGSLVVLGLGCGDDPVPMTAALGPLVSMVTEDLNVAAMIIKLSAG